MSGAEGKVGVCVHPLATLKLGELKRKNSLLSLSLREYCRTGPTRLYHPDPIAEQVHSHSFQGFQHAL